MSEELDIAALGAVAVLRPAGASCDEGDLVFDLIGRPRGFVTFPHVHAGQVERFEILAGGMRVDLGGRSHLLGPGDRFEVPADVAHRQRPTGTGPGHVRVTVSPAGRSEQFLRRISEMSAAGQFNRAGLPRAVAGARLVRDFADTGHAAFPPVAIQRVIATTTLAAARAGKIPRRARRRMWREYAFVDEWDVPAAAEAVYAVLLDGERYPLWWRPVYISVESDGPPRVGATSRQHFKGRLPYHLHTRSTLVRLEPGRVIEAEVDGDLRGRGIWTLTPTESGGTRVRFDWTVHADRLLLRALTPLLRPLLRDNHRWAIARAVEGLEPYLARTHIAEPVS